MTDDMLELARENQRRAGLENVEFLKGDYRRLLAEVGFEDVEVEPTRVYTAEDARGFLVAEGLDPEAVAPAVDGRFMSAFVRARKPA